MKERDSQRSKLYTAEKEALEQFATPLPKVEDIQAYILKQSARTTLQTRYGRAREVANWPIMIGDGRRTRRALAYGTNKMTFPRWARKDWVVLHEWAHIIHNRLDARGSLLKSNVGTRTEELQGGASHGWQYAAIYLDLVRFCMGKEAYEALKAAFKTHKVRYKPKRSVVVTEEMLGRLKAARENLAAGASE
jgi:hypothetical protein